MTIPPFRADHVGSLLRPREIKEARTRHAQGEITAEDLRAIEDRAIERLIARQEEAGLKGVTDGELRRAFFNFDFIEHLDGIEAADAEGGFTFGGGKARARVLNVVGKVGFSGHPMIEQFKFLKARTKQTPKWTIPSPSMVHFRFGRKFVSEDAYPDMEEFFDDVAEAFRLTVKAFADAGCRYLQFDECPLIYLCDPVHRKMLTDRGEDPDRVIEIYARMLDHAASGAPGDMTVAMHLCRGNYRSTHAASGGYTPIADLLFNAIGVDSYFLEYDTERAGDFAPLSLVPSGKTIVLGLLTSKVGELERKDDITRRIDAAARIVPLEQLCLSPQCGFASTEEGNELTEDQQWRKLEFVSGIAREVWGDS